MGSQRRLTKAAASAAAGIKELRDSPNPIWPVGSILCSGRNAPPQKILGYGLWTLLNPAGKTVVTTSMELIDVCYWLRTA